MRTGISIAIVSAAVFLFAGCQTADQKIPEIATAYCKCLTETEKGIGDKTKDIMRKASNADNPDKVVDSEMEKLSEEDRMSVATEMASLGKLAENGSIVGRCMADVDEKYSKMRTLNQTKFYQKLITELESKQGCTLTAILMKLGMKEKIKEGK